MRRQRSDAICAGWLCMESRDSLADLPETCIHVCWWFSARGQGLLKQCGSWLLCCKGSEGVGFRVDTGKALSWRKVNSRYGASAVQYSTPA